MPHRSISRRPHGASLVALALFALLAAGCGHGRGPDPELGATPLREAMEQGPVPADPLFWRAHSAGGAELHLLGSMHFGPASGWHLPAAVEDAFEAADAVVVEVDLRQGDSPEVQALAVRYGVLPPGQSIDQHVSPETLALLADWAARRGIPVEQLAALRPWMIGMAVALDAMSGVGLVRETGIEQHFMDRVGDRAVIELETAAGQLSMFTELSPEVQDLALRDTLEQEHDAEGALLRLAEAWRRGNGAAIEAETVAATGRYPALAAMDDVLLTRRNRDMADRLAALSSSPAHAGDRVFVMVGAAHFLGDDGIVALLRAKGIETEQLGPQQAGSATGTEIAEAGVAP